jgi:hypothetical protein
MRRERRWLREMNALIDTLPPVRDRIIELLGITERGDLSHGAELVTLASQLVDHAERGRELLENAPARYASVAEETLPVVTRCALELSDATGSLLASMARL